MAEKITYDVVQNIGVLSESGAWETQVNLISWNHGKPKFDIRKWNTETEKMSKGISLTEDEFRALGELIANYFDEQEEEE